MRYDYEIECKAKELFTDDLKGVEVISDGGQILTTNTVPIEARKTFENIFLWIKMLKCRLKGLRSLTIISIRMYDHVQITQFR